MHSKQLGERKLSEADRTHVVIFRPNVMDSPPFKFPPTPSMPLFPLSPERVNTRAAQSNNGQGVPSSPSMPELGRPKHMQSNSEVQAMVSRFNSLEINDHAELHKRDAAALKRAQMGREEAETELQRCREEARQLRKGIDEGNGRERKVMKRLDVVMVCNPMVALGETCMEGSQWKADETRRRTYTDKRKLSHPPRPYMNARSGEPEKKPSNPHHHLSSSKKTSNRRAHPSQYHALTSERNADAPDNATKMHLQRNTSSWVCKRIWRRSERRAKCSRANATL